LKLANLTKGTIAEFYVMIDLLKKGLKPSQTLPFFRYDIVVETPYTLLKIQVKSIPATLEKVRLNYTIKEVDIIAVANVTTGVVVYIRNTGKTTYYFKEYHERDAEWFNTF
jgi:hypothetical protein